MYHATRHVDSMEILKALSIVCLAVLMAVNQWAVRQSAGAARDLPTMLAIFPRNETVPKPGCTGQLGTRALDPSGTRALGSTETSAQHAQPSASASQTSHCVAKLASCAAADAEAAASVIPPDDPCRRGAATTNSRRRVKVREIACECFCHEQRVHPRKARKCVTAIPRGNDPNASESLAVARSRKQARAWRAAVAKGRGPRRRGSSHDAQQNAHRCACHARL